MTPYSRVWAPADPLSDLAVKVRPLRLVHRAVESVELTPGSELSVRVGGAQVSVSRADLPRSLSWEAGQLNFSNESLTTAVERMNRYTKEKITLGEPEVGGLRINGVFNAGDSSAFLEAIKSFDAVEIEHEPGELVIKLKHPRK